MSYVAGMEGTQKPLIDTSMLGIIVEIAFQIQMYLAPRDAILSHPLTFEEEAHTHLMQNPPST